LNAANLDPPEVFLGYVLLGGLIILLAMKLVPPR